MMSLRVRFVTRMMTRVSGVRAMRGEGDAWNAHDRLVVGRGDAGHARQQASSAPGWP